MLQGKWLPTRPSVHGGVKRKKKKGGGDTPRRQEEAAPAHDAFVHNHTLETLFNYGVGVSGAPW